MKNILRNLRSAIGYYRDIRLSNLHSPRYKHLFLLLYWPPYGLLFGLVESKWPSIWESITGEPLVFFEVACPLDSWIPFCEWFVIPYYFWFAYLVGMLLYGLLFDRQSFRDCMYFIMLTYSATIVIYLLWPNMQALRPAAFDRENVLTWIVQKLYNFDTNTNVCPSIHVLGSVAVSLTGLRAPRLQHWGWKVFFHTSNLLICMSTVFLKQHSILDVFAALLLCAIAYPFAFYILGRKQRASERIGAETN
ncbi:MAG: phosphatase PAP2 family protein [Clostridia bacterium]|nr:phosphatase PAP2 family protein [Clostridia bacterium]